jgi:hypothetical protein
MADIGHFVARSPINVRDANGTKRQSLFMGSDAAQKVAILDPADLLGKLAL